jgi:hypothetical protein
MRAERSRSRRTWNGESPPSGVGFCNGINDEMCVPSFSICQRCRRRQPRTRDAVKTGQNATLLRVFNCLQELKRRQVAMLFDVMNNQHGRGKRQSCTEYPNFSVTFARC